MDKVFSTRLSEELTRQIDRFVKERSMSKKGLVEKALRMYLSRVGGHMERDIVDRTFGSWERDEAPNDTWHQARQVFNKAFSRHTRPRGDNHENLR